ncbi:MAG: hypothetical protein Kow00120_06750 [Anaerolineae bacterium]
MLNLRHNADRWPERRALVIAALRAEQPDVIAFQEVWLPIRQAHDIAEALNAPRSDRPYHVVVAEKSLPDPQEGIALLSRAPIVEHERLALPGAGGRVAQRIRIEVGGRMVDVANVHLHHRPFGDESVRLPQVRRLLDWMFARGDGVARRWLLAGDFNAPPETPTVQAARARLESACRAVQGVEPGTFPTPMAEADYPGGRVTLDYVFYDPAHFRAEAAWLACARPHPDDPTLYPSDHFGLAATFSPR